MRILVCGSRHFTDKVFVYNELCDLIDTESLQDHFVITGDAKGVDYLAVDWAIYFDYPYQVFYSDWNKHGKAAGPIRNKQMLDEGKPDVVIAFLAKDSRGTKNMIEQAEKAGIPVKVINIE